MADAAASTTNPIIEAMKNGETLGDIQSIVEKNPAALMLRDKDGDLPLHYALDRIGTVDKADVALDRIETVKADVALYLLKACPEALQVGDAKGRLPLHVVFLHGAPPRGMVKRLVEKYPQARLVKDRDGCTPLQAVQHLVTPEPKSVLVRSNNGESPVGLAVRVAAPINVLRFLIEQCPDEAIRERSVDGMTPLHAAARDYELDFANCILALWPDAVQQRSNDGSLPLHVAARCGSCSLSKRLHQLWPESIKEATYDGWIPLHEAASAMEEEAVKYLVKQWPESVRARTNSGLLPLHFAVQHRPWSNCRQGVPSRVSRVLCYLHPEKRVEYITTEGIRHLHIKAGRGGKFRKDQPEHSYNKWLQDTQSYWRRIVQLLVEQDSKTVREPSNEGLYPLYYAIAGCLSAPAVKILLDHWPESVELRTNDGSSLLHLAVAREIPSLALVECLVKRRSEMLTEWDSSGSLPLHCAVAQTNASVQVVKFLVKRSPMSVGQANGRGLLPLHIAALSGAPLDVVYLLAVKFPRVVRDEGRPGGRQPKRARLS